MWSSRRSQVVGLVAVVLTVGTVVMTLSLVRAGAEPTVRVPVIELDGGPAPTTSASPTVLPTTPPPAPATPPPAPATPPPSPTTAAPPPPAPAPEPARTGGPARVVPPAPVPAGPRDGDADDDEVGDDADDEDDEGVDGGDD